MKKLVFRNGICTVLRPLYYSCKVFGLASYSYVADRRNKRVTADYGFLNCMFTVMWLIVFIVGLPVQILTLSCDNFDSRTLFIAFMSYVISSNTSIILAIVWVSVIKSRIVLEKIEYVSEVDNRIRYTLQEETYMNREVNIISETIQLTVIQCILIPHITYLVANEPYYIIVILTLSVVPDICNTLVSFQFVTLVFMLKQMYSLLNKRLKYWIIVQSIDQCV